MLFRLDAKINNESLDTFINVANDLQPFEELDLFIRGEGGELGVTDTMINIINKLTLTNIVNLHAYEYIMSSHFHLFFKAKAHSKTLTSSSYGMIHKGEWSHNLVEGYNVRDESYNLFMKSYITQTDSIKDLNSFVKFDKNELKSLKENKDLYILPTRMNEILSYNMTKTQAKPLKFPKNDNN